MSRIVKIRLDIDEFREAIPAAVLTAFRARGVTLSDHIGRPIPPADMFSVLDGLAREIVQPLALARAVTEDEE